VFFSFILVLISDLIRPEICLKFPGWYLWVLPFALFWFDIWICGLGWLTSIVHILFSKHSSSAGRLGYDWAVFVDLSGKYFWF